jgi:hypothetical protein
MNTQIKPWNMRMIHNDDKLSKVLRERKHFGLKVLGFSKTKINDIEELDGDEPKK